MKKVLINWVPVLLFCGIIFFLSTMSASSSVEIKNLDLFLHAAIYFVFVVLLCRATALKIKFRKLIYSIVIITLATLYGAFMEWFQSYIPTRSMSLSDGIANAVGACLGLLFYISYFRLKGAIK